MKKIFLLLICMSISFSMIGCTDKKQNAPADNNAPSSQQQSAAPESELVKQEKPVELPELKIEDIPNSNNKNPDSSVSSEPETSKPSQDEKQPANGSEQQGEKEPAQTDPALPSGGIELPDIELE